MPMRDSPSPRFTSGDRVIVTCPGIHRGKKGFVIEVIEKPGDAVVRYRVRFADAVSAIFFGFELVHDS
jgi:hypothetical protein